MGGVGVAHFDSKYSAPRQHEGGERSVAELEDEGAGAESCARSPEEMAHP